MVSRQVGDSKPPQAIVKPQILTHIIEGFVIQEGAEPFPVRILCCGGRRVVDFSLWTGVSFPTFQLKHF